LLGGESGIQPRPVLGLRSIPVQEICESFLIFFLSFKGPQTNGTGKCATWCGSLAGLLALLLELLDVRVAGHGVILAKWGEGENPSVGA